MNVISNWALEPAGIVLSKEIVVVCVSSLYLIIGDEVTSLPPADIDVESMLTSRVFRAIEVESSLTSRLSIITLAKS